MRRIMKKVTRTYSKAEWEPSKTEWKWIVALAFFLGFLAARLIYGPF